MKRIALAVAVVVMAAGACKKAENANTTANPPADTMKMAPHDTTHMMADTSKHMAAPAPAPATKAPAPAPVTKAPAKRRP